jgi:hypothetical protein
MLYGKILVLLIILATMVPLIFFIKIYVTVVHALFLFFGKTTACVYIIIYLALREAIIFFTPLLDNKTIKYDFVTDRLYFFLKPNLLYWIIPEEKKLEMGIPKVLNKFDSIIYSEGFIWYKFKEKYVFTIRSRKKKFEFKSLVSYRDLRWRYPIIDLLYSLYKRIEEYRWFDIIGSVIIINLLVFSIPFKICLTSAYTSILLYQILISKSGKGVGNIYRLYIHELFLSYKWFKFILPKTAYVYIVARGETFYFTDWEWEGEGFSKFPIYYFNQGLFDPIFLYLGFNIFVESYYTSFRRVECLIQLISGEQNMYTTGTKHKFYLTQWGPDDLRNISIPSSRNRLNPHSYFTRLLSGVLFMSLEHVRVTFVFIERIKRALRFGDINSLSVHEPLREGLLQMRSHIFTTSNITRSAKYERMYKYGDILTHNISELNPYKIKSGERVYIVVSPTQHIHISRPNFNWEFYGQYSHLALADIVFKLDWRYLFRNTDGEKDKIEGISDSWN